jgi:hypothetical protein
MVLLNKLAVRALDFLLGRPGGDAENLVGIERSEGLGE